MFNFKAAKQSFAVKYSLWQSRHFIVVININIDIYDQKVQNEVFKIYENRLEFNMKTV